MIRSLLVLFYLTVVTVLWTYHVSHFFASQRCQLMVNQIDLEEMRKQEQTPKGLRFNAQEIV